MNRHNRSRRSFLTATVAVGSVALAGCLATSTGPSESAAFATAVTYYDPNCGCCAEHAAYLETADTDVERVREDADTLTERKEALGIPPEYRSCHTTIVEDEYVIEGHVPVSIINEVVDRQPDADVIALPGMPSGSPGMPGSKDGEWVFYAISEDGDVDEFTRK